LKGFSRESVKRCLLSYLLVGWSGYVPAACQNTIVPVPIDFTWLAWGWPDRFIDRMTRAGSMVLLTGPYGAADRSDGIDQPSYAARIPQGFPGYVWTNNVDVVLASRAFAGRAKAAR
jgi:glycerophosphoryl diester phosphodiesterase